MGTPILAERPRRARLMVELVGFGDEISPNRDQPFLALFLALLASALFTLLKSPPLLSVLILAMTDIMLTWNTHKHYT